MLLNLSRSIVTRVLLLMLLFGVISSPTNTELLQPNGACVAPGACNTM